MSDALGIPRVVFGYWVILSGVLLVASLLQGVFILPSLVSVYLLAPDALAYVIYAGMAWVAFYAALSMAVVGALGSDSVQDLVNSLGVWEKVSVLALAAIPVNAIVLIAGGIGVVVGGVVTPIAGLMIALAYPLVELRFVVSYPTPARLITKVVLGPLHLLGAARDVSADAVINSFVKRPGDPPGPATRP